MKEPDFAIIPNIPENRFIRHDMKYLVDGITFIALMVKLKHADTSWAR